MGKSIDITGQRFERLVVVGMAGQDRWKAALCLCRCDCGAEKTVSSNNLRMGRVRSCGCLRSEESRARKFRPNGEAAKVALLIRYRINAKRRDLAWDISEERFLVLISGNCRYCGCPPSALKQLPSGSSMIYNGIDRRNSAKGYVEDNVVSCCSSCNYAKRNMSQADFIAWIHRTAKHLTNNPLE